jgi:hypothetical protein
LNYFRYDGLKDVVIDSTESQIKSSSLLYNLNLIESSIGTKVKVKDTADNFTKQLKQFYEKVNE